MGKYDKQNTNTTEKSVEMVREVNAIDQDLEGKDNNRTYLEEDEVENTLRKIIKGSVSDNKRLGFFFSYLLVAIIVFIYACIDIDDQVSDYDNEFHEETSLRSNSERCILESADEVSFSNFVSNMRELFVSGVSSGRSKLNLVTFEYKTSNGTTSRSAISKAGLDNFEVVSANFVDSLTLGKTFLSSEFVVISAWNSSYLSDAVVHTSIGSGCEDKSNDRLKDVNQKGSWAEWAKKRDGTSFNKQSLCEDLQSCLDMWTCPSDGMSESILCMDAATDSYGCDPVLLPSNCPTLSHDCGMDEVMQSCTDAGGNNEPGIPDDDDDTYGTGGCPEADACQETWSSCKEGNCEEAFMDCVFTNVNPDICHDFQSTCSTELRGWAEVPTVIVTEACSNFLTERICAGSPSECSLIHSDCLSECEEENCVNEATECAKPIVNSICTSTEWRSYCICHVSTYWAYSELNSFRSELDSECLDSQLNSGQNTGEVVQSLTENNFEQFLDSYAIDESLGQVFVDPVTDIVQEGLYYATIEKVLIAILIPFPHLNGQALTGIQPRGTGCIDESDPDLSSFNLFMKLNKKTWQLMLKYKCRPTKSQVFSFVQIRIAAWIVFAATIMKLFTITFKAFANVDRFASWKTFAHGVKEFVLGFYN